MITGCDTGFGNQLAVECDKLGFHVFAGVLEPDGNGAKDLMKTCSQRTRILRLNVTIDDQVINALTQIESSGLPLWAVINNAGICVAAPIEWGKDDKRLTDIFDVNVFGAVRVAKHCLPLLRQSKGRIINISSIAGMSEAEMCILLINFN